MARTVMRGGRSSSRGGYRGSSGGRGGGYYGGRSSGERGRGGWSSSSYSARPIQAANANDCVCPENAELVIRLRSWAQFRQQAVTQNMDDRQFWMAAKELSKHTSIITNETEAKRVHKIGPMIAGKLKQYMDWRQVISRRVPTQLGRFEAYEEKNRWWRIERCDLPPKFLTRRSWGMLDTVGYDECFHTFASAEVAERNVTSAIKAKLKEGYQQVDNDPGDTGIGGSSSTHRAQFDDEYEDDPELVREAREIEQNMALSASSKARSKARTIAANTQPRKNDIRAELFKWYDIDDPQADRRQAREEAEAAAASRGDGVRGREYAPKLLNSAGNVSGVAAMIIALYRAQTQNLGFSGWSKDEIADNAQPLCPDVNMRPRQPNGMDFRDGSAHYGAISSLSSTLVRNEIVETYPIKSKFRLTYIPGKGLISGIALGERLDAEYTKWKGPDKDNFKVVSVLKQPSQKEPKVFEILDSSDEENKNDDDSDVVILDVAPQKSHAEKIIKPTPPSFPRTNNDSLFDKMYDVLLVVDSREKRQNALNECEAMIGCLHDTYHVPKCVKRSLDVADYLWLAQPKNSTCSDWRRESIVLGTAVERKIVSDFNTTVRGGTHHTKQRLRMRRCPIAHCTYLVEGDIEQLESAANRKMLLDEMAALELLDGFTVHCSQDFNGTAAYLKALDDIVRQDLVGKSVSEVLDRPDVFPYAKIVNSLDVDPHKWPLKQRWATMLLHLPNLKRDHVTAIVQSAGYDTPTSLTQALREHHAPGQPLLTTQLEPGKKRAKLASDVAHFFTSRDYSAPPVASTSSAAPPRRLPTHTAEALFS